MSGWIKLHRRFIQWEWFGSSEMVHLFTYLLLSANSEDSHWNGIDIKRGQFVTGLNALHNKTNISIRKLRTCLSRLKATGEINIKSTNKYSIITICNYEEYQDRKSESDNQSTSKRQANDKQTTTNKNIRREEYKKDNDITYQRTTPVANLKKEAPKEIKIPERKQKSAKDFISEIVDIFVEEHGSYVIITPGKERTAASKILQLYKLKHPGQDAEQIKEGLRKYFRKCIDIDDRWLSENISLSIIVSQFNRINNILNRQADPPRRKLAL